MSDNERSTQLPIRKGLDPQVEDLLQLMDKLEIMPLCKLNPTEAREMMKGWTMLSAALEEVAQVENLTISGPAGPIPIRIYTPQGVAPFPILVFFHGGGFVIGDIDTHDNLCRSLANGASCVVVSVDYRLAPEHKFPAAVEDAYCATQWASDNVNRLKGDPARVAVGGDSAGGNLATVVSIMARDRNGPHLVYQLLIYPATNLSSSDTNSYRDFGDGYLLTKEDGEYFLDHYLRNEEDKWNWMASPFLAPDLSGLPSALVISGEFDILRDENEAYVNRLKEAGIPTKWTCYSGMIHGFMSMDGLLDRARDAIDEASAELREAFLTF